MTRLNSIIKWKPLCLALLREVYNNGKCKNGLLQKGYGENMERVNSIEEIDKLKDENDMLLVYFGSHLCSVCIAMMPKLEALLKKYPDIKAVKVEVEKMPELSANYNVFAVPVIILFIQGKETIREARIISLIGLEESIRRYYEFRSFFA